MAPINHSTKISTVGLLLLLLIQSSTGFRSLHVQGIRSSLHSNQQSSSSLHALQQSFDTACYSNPIFSVATASSPTFVSAKKCRETKKSSRSDSTLLLPSLAKDLAVVSPAKSVNNDPLPIIVSVQASIRTLVSLLASVVYGTSAITISSAVRQGMKSVLQLVPPSIRCFFQPLLIVYYVPLFLVRHYMNQVRYRIHQLPAVVPAVA